MTDENAVDPTAPDEVQAQAAQDESEAAELQAQPGPVDEPDEVEPQATVADPPQPASVSDIEAARSGQPAQATDAGAVSPSAGSEDADALDARLTAIEGRLDALEQRGEA